MRRLELLLVMVQMQQMMMLYSQEDSAGGDSGPSESCEHQNFYCDFQQPTVFYRCIDQDVHTFHCPTGLHFSVGTQTCDWPHLADCSAGEDYAEIRSENNIAGKVANNIKKNGLFGKNQGRGKAGSLDQVKASGLSQSEANSWFSQTASAGNSWWRPEGLRPQQWRDIDSIKKPDFKPHVSNEPKSEVVNSQSRSHLKKPSRGSNGSKVVQKHESSKACSDQCRLPACFCAGNSIPNGLPASSVPQMVMITFDDEVSGAYYGYYQRLFRPGRYNPNGCPIRGGLFVSGSGTDYDLVYPLYAMGFEIASHSISHRFPHTWWASASHQDFLVEAEGMRDNLVRRSGIPREAVRGFRVPFLQLGGDNMYSALHDSKFVYDTSMFTGNQWEGDLPIWPFTLDHVLNNTFCQHGPCPTKPYPGLWEIPVQRWYGLDGHSCAQPDGCSSSGDTEETFEFFKSNFKHYHGSNRAPFGIFVHARWFHSDHHLEALDIFIDYLLRLDDVYIVTPGQVIDWMRKPTTLSHINSFVPWTCQGGAKDVWTDK